MKVNYEICEKMAFTVLLASLLGSLLQAELKSCIREKITEKYGFFNCIKLELNTVYVIYSGPTDAAGVTSSAENEEHSQIIIHCTPSTGTANTFCCSFLL